ncbi:MAG: hypothetical protein ABIJ61_09680 [bacterium]
MTGKPDASHPTLFLITAQVWRSRPIFAQEEAALAVLDQLHRCLVRLEISLVAYVLLPARLLVILDIPQQDRLADFGPLFLSRSSRAIRKLDLGPLGGALYQSGRFQLWQKHLEQLPISSETEFRSKLEFVHLRPVKAGLVDAATDWPYSSAADWDNSGTGPLGISRDIRWL